MPQTDPLFHLVNCNSSNIVWYIDGQLRKVEWTHVEASSFCFSGTRFFSLRYHWSRSKSEMTPPTFQIQSLFSHTVLIRHHTSASIRRATPDVGGDIVSQNRGHRCSKSGRRWLIRVSPTRIIAGVLLAPAFWLYRKILNCYWKINKKNFRHWLHIHTPDFRNYQYCYDFFSTYLTWSMDLDMSMPESDCQSGVASTTKMSNWNLA